MKRLVLTLLVLLGFTATANAQVKAFPSAEGFGTDTIGGRGGVVCKVTNLNDSGSGSFRACALMTVPRIVVFDVSGTIKLQSRISLIGVNSFITIAGQTAPGDGIQLQGGDLYTTNGVHDVVIRHMRFRNGTIYTDETLPPNLADGTRYAASRDTYSLLSWPEWDNVVLDHLDIEWGLDQTFSMNCGNVNGMLCKGTVQWTIIAEAMASGNLFGPLLGGEDSATTSSMTWHHNLIAHFGSRVPTLQPYAVLGNPGFSTNLDFRNNVIYDYGSNQWPKCATVFHSESDYNDWRDSGRTANRVNVVGNRSIRGINTLTCCIGAFHIGHFCKIYLRDNWAGGASGPVDGFAARVDFVNTIGVPWSDPDSGSGYEHGTYNPASLPSSGFNAVQATEFAFPPVTTHSASTVRDVVLANVGATKPKVDAVTSRIRNSVVSLTGGFGRGTCDVAVFPESVFGFTFNTFPCAYPTLTSTTAPTDTDGDGMPNSWETTHGLNSNSASDGPAFHANGYTNLENYLNCLAGDTVPGNACNDPITPAGTITNVAPSSGIRTVVGLNVVLTGSGTTWVNGTSVGSFSGTGITVNSTTVASGTSATLNITIASNATLGLRNVVMTTGGVVETGNNIFTVNALPAGAITNLTPSSGTQGTSASLTVTGSNTNWVNGTTFASFSGSGIVVNSTTVASSTSATASVTITSGATLGTRNLLMTTGSTVDTLTNGFTVNAGVPTQLIFSLQPPSSINSGVVMSAVSISVQFANGSTSPVASNAITIAKCGGSPAGTLSGTLVRNASNGIATFNDLAISSTTGGTTFTLCATASGLTGATSNTFTVVGIGPPTKLTFTTQPPTAINSAAVMPTVRVAVQYANSTTDTSSTASVVIAKCVSSPAGTLGGTLTRNAVAGVASFNDLTLTSGVGGSTFTLCVTSAGLTSATSNTFTVNTPTESPTKLSFIIQPPASVILNPTLPTAIPTVTVAVQFAGGGTSTGSTSSVTLTLCSGTGTLGGTLVKNAVEGIASFTDLTLSSSTGGSNYQLCAASSGLTSATSNIFSAVTPPPIASKLGVVVQPPAFINTGSVLNPFSIAVQLADGSTDINAVNSVNIALCGGSFPGSLTGTLARSAINGIATFSNLVLTSSVSAVATLCATSTGLTSTITNPITVNVPVTPNVCSSNPVRIKHMKWPSSQSGSRSLGWDSGGYSIVSIQYTYPKRATFTDVRGCTATVTR